MKRIFGFFWISVITPLFGLSQITNQKLFDTIGFLPDHYLYRKAMFEKEPVQTDCIMFIGNSITEMGDWKKLLHDSTVINRGIGGDITFTLLKRMDDIIRRKPSKAFLLIGINDVGKDIPDAVIADNIGKIIHRLQVGSPETKIYVQSILPVNPEINGFPQHYDKQGHILSANRFIKKTAEKMNVPFVNIHDLLADKNGRLEAKYTIDGLHLSATGGGYEKWVKYLRSLGYL